MSSRYFFLIVKFTFFQSNVVKRNLFIVDWRQKKNNLFIIYTSSLLLIWPIWRRVPKNARVTVFLALFISHIVSLNVWLTSLEGRQIAKLDHTLNWSRFFLFSPNFERTSSSYRKMPICRLTYCMRSRFQKSWKNRHLNGEARDARRQCQLSYANADLASENRASMTNIDLNSANTGGRGREVNLSIFYFDLNVLK